jgi:polyisoprenoid-binding protein YceI
MRKIALALALSNLPLSAALASSYTIDPAHTFPHFSINHLGFSTMRGRFDSTSGKLNLDMEKKTAAVDITIDANSISTGFAKRDQHLRSPDFLNAAEYPEIKFTSTKVTFNGDKSAKVEGNLTIAGATKPVTLNVHSINCGRNPMNKKEMCGFDASTKIKRSDFGVNYGLPAIGDEMEMVFEVEAVKD